MVSKQYNRDLSELHMYCILALGAELSLFCFNRIPDSKILYWFHPAMVLHIAYSAVRIDARCYFGMWGEGSGL